MKLLALFTLISVTAATSDSPLPPVRATPPTAHIFSSADRCLRPVAAAAVESPEQASVAATVAAATVATAAAAFAAAALHHDGLLQ